MHAPNLHLPREQWTSHPHYPDQVLLVGSHTQFRRFSRMLIDHAGVGQETATISQLFRYWKSGMHSHEAYEEKKLYPYLTARWGLSCALLRDGHHRLAAAEVDVLESIPGAHGTQSDALAQALAHHDEVLSKHLDEEEDVVVPALLALTPEEFDTYYHSNIHRLLSQLSRK